MTFSLLSWRFTMKYHRCSPLCATYTLHTVCTKVNQFGIRAKVFLDAMQLLMVFCLWVWTDYVVYMKKYRRRDKWERCTSAARLSALMASQTDSSLSSPLVSAIMASTVLFSILCSLIKPSYRITSRCLGGLTTPWNPSHLAVITWFNSQLTPVSWVDSPVSRPRPPSPAGSVCLWKHFALGHQLKSSEAETVRALSLFFVFAWHQRLPHASQWDTNGRRLVPERHASLGSPQPELWTPAEQDSAHRQQ